MKRNGLIPVEKTKSELNRGVENKSRRRLAGEGVNLAEGTLGASDHPFKGRKADAHTQIKRHIWNQ